MYNNLIAIGNVGKDPEMRFTANGTPVTTFSVATNHSHTGEDGQKQTETEWFNVVAWNKLAELCNQYLAKGRRVYVEGRVRTRSWEGQDGTKKYRTEVVANKVLFLERNGQGPDKAEEVPGGSGSSQDIEELPFG